MNPVSVICEGAPRDLGESQGSHCAGAIRDRVARAGLRVSRRLPWPRRFAGGPILGAGMGREVIRQYPHLAERMTGLAGAAGLPVDALMDLHVSAGYGPQASAVGEASLLAVVAGDGTARLVRTVCSREDPGSQWILRTSRPEIGFASVEVVQPWHVAPVAGVNDAGLSAAIAHDAAAAPSRALASAPPPILLVQECLQRFDGLEAAIAWCLERPNRGGASLVLTDARGKSATVHLRGSDSLVARSTAGVTVMGDGAAAKSLQEQLESGVALDADSVAAALALEECLCRAMQIWIDPAERELRIRSASAREAARLQLPASED